MTNNTHEEMTMATTKRIKEIAAALTAAANAAREADAANSEDGGTCNFDAPAFRVERAAEKTIEAAAVEAGLTVCSFTWFGKKWFWLNVCEGMANRRSRMATAAAKALREFEATVKGFHASCYYQMD